MLEGGDVERPVLAAELHQVQGRQVAGRVVQEHVLRARVGGVDPAALGRAGVPVVDGGVVLDARIGRGPGGIADLVPQLLGLERLGVLPSVRRGQVPVAVVLRPPRRNSSVTRTELLEFWPETVR
jgi:hypothetical protein